MMMTASASDRDNWTGVLYWVKAREGNLRRTMRYSLFYIGWLLLLLVHPTVLLIWMNDPYVHATEISGDSVREEKNTSNAAKPPAQVRAWNSSDSKHQAFAVSLADGIGIAAILIRTSDVHQHPPELDSPTHHPEQTFVVDEKPRKRGIVEIALLILVLLALALFSSPWLKPRV
jgi:hypothetical protein